MKPKLHIGVEIEVNNIYNLSVSSDIWNLHSEHCGYELTSFPAKSPGAILKLIKSIKEMNRQCNGEISFDNAGTHIHIDFLNDGAQKIDLQRRQCAYDKGNGRWRNPLGTGKRFYWVDKGGKNWKSPKHYMSINSNTLTPQKAYVVKNKKFVTSVKRFLLIGMRFSNLLFALQHHSRRFNKYCHSISGWSEEILMNQESVEEICRHINLAQGHRRHMFNALSFSKFGTIEVRMIRASLNANEIWRQIYLFSKLAQLAKSNKNIPQSTGNVMADFLVLFNAAGIRGNMRKRLIASINLSGAPWIARCFNCEDVYSITDIMDFGLSRPICTYCFENNNTCIKCGYVGTSAPGDSSWQLVDNVGPGEYRGLCHMCRNSTIHQVESINNSLFIMGIQLGSGFDNKGPNTLRNLRETFCKN